MAGKNTINVVIYLSFWALYGPLAVATWYYEKASLLKLGIVLLIGLGMVLFGLFIKEKFLDSRKSALSEDLLPESPEKPSEGHPEWVSGAFENVFKPDFGRVEYDLD